METMSERRLPTHIHLIGIGGIGISAIAHILAVEGYIVSGSDLRASPLTVALNTLGVTIYVGHAAEHVQGAEMVVASSAIPEGNIEIVAARAAGIPVLRRQQFLPLLLTGRTVVAVAGTHGKTTTTAMITEILLAAGLDPSCIVGGVLASLGGNARRGAGPYFVIEADEYERMFHGLAPHVAVVTNLEMDHPDCFRDLDDLVEAFCHFLENVPPGGQIIACADSPAVRQVLAACAWAVPVTTYGLSVDADYRLDPPQMDGQGRMLCRVWHGDQEWAAFTLGMAGVHNALNATAAALAAERCGVPASEAGRQLAAYRGTQRRFELKGEAGGVTVVDDYAHHPTEIRATLAAARLRYPGRRIVAVFQPHTYSRLRTLFAEFAASFDQADEAWIMDVYAARVKEQNPLSAADLVSAMRRPCAHYAGPAERTEGLLREHLRAGDVLLTLGAGDGYLVGEHLLASLERRP